MARVVDPNFKLLLRACYILADEKNGSSGTLEKSDAELDTLILKYKGHEEELFHTICDKYGLDSAVVMLSLADAQKRLEEKGSARHASLQTSRLGRSRSSTHHAEEEGAEEGRRVEEEEEREKLATNKKDTIGLSRDVDLDDSYSNLRLQLSLVEIHRRIDEARRKVQTQTTNISKLIAERGEREREVERLGRERHDEIAILTHTATALRIEMARLEGKTRRWWREGSHQSGEVNVHRYGTNDTDHDTSRLVNAGGSINNGINYHHGTASVLVHGVRDYHEEPLHRGEDSGDYVPISLMTELYEENTALTKRLAEAMRLRRLVEKSLGGRGHGNSAAGSFSH